MNKLILWELEWSDYNLEEKCDKTLKLPLLGVLKLQLKHTWLYYSSGQIKCIKKVISNGKICLKGVLRQFDLSNGVLDFNFKKPITFD